MIQLYLKECKKLFLKRITLVLFLIAVIFGFAGRTTNVHGEAALRGYDEQGNIVEGNVAESLYREYQNAYAGIVDEAWFAKVQEDLREIDLQDTLRNIDEQSMVEAYGADWKTTYLNNPEGYSMYTKEDVEKYNKEHPGVPIEQDKTILYINGYIGSIKSSALYDAYNYARNIIEKPWNSNEEMTIHGQDGPTRVSTFSYRDMGEEEKAWTVQELNSISSFLYAPYQGWGSLLSGMATARFFVAILIVFATSRLFNEDHSYEMMDLVKSTSYGKQKLVFAKLCALLSFCILTIMAYTAILTIGVYLIDGLGNWNVNLVASTNMMSLYTFKEAYMGGFLYLMTGACWIGFLSALFSAFIKKNYISFVVSTLFLLIPLAMPNGMKDFFPLEYMDFTGTYFSGIPTHLFGSYDYLQPYLYTSSAIVIVACGIGAMLYYRSYRINK